MSPGMDEAKPIEAKPDGAKPVIAAKGLSMRFGSTLALNAVDIEIKSGITGLVGANGAGKSTLLKLVMGLLRPTAGTIETLGRNPQDDGAQVRSHIGYFPERNVLPDTMPAHEFVKHMTRLRGLPNNQARNRASDALWSVGLGEERFRTLGTMSTGQRQRVKLAQALAADPALVLLDEPTEGLDPVQREAMLTLIGEVRELHGVDIVMSSHVLNEVEQVCSEIVVLDGGSVSLAGRINTLLFERQFDGGAAAGGGGAAVGGGGAAAGGGAGGGAVGGGHLLAQVSLELVDDSSSAGAVVQAALQKAGCTIKMSGLEMIVTAPPGLAASSGAGSAAGAGEYDLLCDLCRDAVADAGARLREIGASKRSLEEAVLAAADAAASSAADTDAANANSETRQ